MELPGVLMERPGAKVSGARVRAWCESWRAGAALVMLCLAVYLPGLWSIPPVDRDESRFAQASRTMLETGDYVVPRIQGKARLNKPPLIYWLQAASARVLGDGPGADGQGEWGNGNIWVFRVPSVLCAIGTVLLTWRLGLRMFDARAGALGAALLGVCPMVVWDAHQARADQLLLFTTTGAMYALFVCWKGGGGVARAARPPVVSVVALWVCVALGVLAKGPITPMIVALTAITLSITSRDGRGLLRLRPFLGLVIVAAMVGPWVYLVGREVGWNEYWSVVWHETIGRSAEAAEGHWGPPGYHLVLLSVLLWPGSLTTAAAVVRAWKRGLRGRRLLVARPAEAFLLAWAVPSWIVFELIATKLPHYTMPLYPAIALLSARAALGGLSMPRVGCVVWRIVGVCVLACPFVSVALLIAKSPDPLVLIPGALFFGVAWRITRPSARAVDAGRTTAGLWRVIPVLVVLGAITLEVVFWMMPVWISSEVWGGMGLGGGLREIRRRDPGRPFATVDYFEDSLIFLSRGTLERIEPTQIEAWLARHPDGVLLVSQDRLKVRPDLQHAESILRFSEIGGYNYSTGKWQYLAFAERARPRKGE